MMIDERISRPGERKPSRIREVDLLRGVAIILMITGHSFIVHPINIQDVSWCAALRHWIYTFHMELFFLLAGCVYHCSDYRKYIGKKIDRLAVPYLFFGLIALLLHSAGLEVVNRQTTFGAGLVKLLTQGGNYWFLYALFVLYLIYPLIDKVCRKPWMEYALAVGLVAMISFMALPGLFELRNVVYYTPYFVLGRYSIRLLQPKKERSHFANIGLFVISLVIYIGMDRLFEIYPNVILIRYIRAVAMMLVLYVPVYYLLRAVDYGWAPAKQTERFLNNCSRYSLQLYLFNGFVLVIVRTLVVSILGIHNPFVIVSSLVLGNLLVTLLVCIYLLPKTKWLAWLCGIGKRPWKKDNPAVNAA